MEGSGAFEELSGREVGEMNIKTIPISKVHPATYNPRKDLKPSDPEYQRLAKAVDKFGMVEPLVWNERTGNLVGGHQRFKILKQGGAKTVEVSIVDLDDKDEKALNLALNKQGGEWDLVSLDVMLKELQASDFDMEITGFDTEDLNKYSPIFDAGLTDEDAVPEPPKLPITKSGDLWLLGKHRLLCGDSGNPESIALLMDGQTGVLMATDPPYGINFEDAKYNPRAKHWKAIHGDLTVGPNLTQFIKHIVQVWWPHLAQDTAWYIWTAAMTEGAAAAAGLREAGLHIQAQIIWNKNQFALGQADYHWKHENCWYAFCKGTKHRWFGGRAQSTVWELKKVSNSLYLHPMQKPVELYMIPIQNHTATGEIVCDPFCGSGTQIIAAEMSGRCCYGMEIDPAYVDIAVQRFENFTGQKGILAAAA